jgi:LPS-assembly lipoprotein
MGGRNAKILVGRLVVALASASLAGGCFQPLYGSGAVPGTSNIRDALSSVEVQRIDAPAGSSETKLAVQIQNDLMFNFTGGTSPSPSAYRLKVKISGGRSNIVVVDQSTQLPSAENYGMNASYILTEIASGRDVLSGGVAATVSYDPSGQQRFARISALHDAERRAGKVIADNITTRLASYFVSGS